jgi:hypothetical protein
MLVTCDRWQDVNTDWDLAWDRPVPARAARVQTGSRQGTEVLQLPADLGFTDVGRDE